MPATTGLPWRDAQVGGETVSVYIGGPGYFYALDHATGGVVSGDSHESVVAELERSARRTGK